MNKIKNSIVWTSTALIYLVTVLFHSWILLVTDNKNVLGFVMVIPLLTVILYQRVFLKRKVFATFRLKKPTTLSVVFAISIPIILGGIFQAYFFFAKQ